MNPSRIYRIVGTSETRYIGNAYMGYGSKRRGGRWRQNAAGWRILRLCPRTSATASRSACGSVAGSPTLRTKYWLRNCHQQRSAFPDSPTLACNGNGPTTCREGQSRGDPKKKSWEPPKKLCRCRTSLIMMTAESPGSRQSIPRVPRVPHDGSCGVKPFEEGFHAPSKGV